MTYDRNRFTVYKNSEAIQPRAERCDLTPRVTCRSLMPNSSATSRRGLDRGAQRALKAAVVDAPDCGVNTRMQPLPLQFLRDHGAVRGAHCRVPIRFLSKYTRRAAHPELGGGRS